MEFFTKRGFEYEVHVGYLYQEEITREKAQQLSLIHILSMIQHFFEIGTDPALFDGLKISKNTEICEQYMGKYPVISISLKGIDADSYEKARAQLIKTINREARRFQFLLESDKLSQVDKALFSELLTRNMEEDTITSSLQELTELLEVHYEQQVVVLIDEYDVPMAKAHENGYYDEMAVSYTHLDVYKRQVLYFSNSSFNVSLNAVNSLTAFLSVSLSSTFSTSSPILSTIVLIVSSYSETKEFFICATIFS